MRMLLVATALIGVSVVPALADAPPPHDAKPLSQILLGVENSPNFGYFDEIDWDNGHYEVEYYTNTGTKKEIYIDPVTGIR